MKCDPVDQKQDDRRRAPQGARGLKYSFGGSTDASDGGRAPQGARGLKCADENVLYIGIEVAPRKGRVG